MVELEIRMTDAEAEFMTLQGIQENYCDHEANMDIIKALVEQIRRSGDEV